jgi:hypothetical protein
MKALCCNVSFFEWTSSEAQRNRGGCLTTDGSSGSGKMQLTSFGIKSGQMAHATTMNLDMLERSAKVGDTSAMRQEEPTMAYAVSSNQACSGMLRIARRILKHRGEYNNLD